jgi:tetratricopeptide (TPR) repeat protein
MFLSYPLPLAPYAQRDHPSAMDHPPVFHFDLLLRGELSPSYTRALVLHLLHGCPTCASRLFPDPRRDYEGLFSRLSDPESMLSRALESPPSVLWAELMMIEPEHRLLALQKRRFRSPTFAAWLTHHSGAVASQNPASALLAAETALSLLGQLALHGDTGLDLIHDLRASALAYLGNARRCLGLFAESLEAFAEAESELDADTSDRLARAEFLTLRAGLYKDLGRFEQAAEDLRIAYRLGAAHADPHAQGRILLQLAEVVGPDDPDAGVRILAGAAPKIDPAREPRLQLILLHRRAWFLNDAGKPAHAMEVFRTTWPLYNHWPELRVRGLRSWLWGRIERSFGEPEQAEVYLSRAVDLFRELGAAHDHAISGLDLAGVYLRLGQDEAARHLLVASLDFLAEHLHAQGLDRWQALARGALTPDLLKEAGDYFHRFWNVPR